MKRLNILFMFVAMMALLPKPANACEDGCSPFGCVFGGIFAAGFAVQILPTASSITTGIIALIYSKKEYDKNNDASKNSALASAILNPIGGTFSLIAFTMGILNQFRHINGDVEKKYAGASSLTALLATGSFVGATIASGIAYGANESYETSRALGLSLAGAVMSLIPAGLYTYRHLQVAHPSAANPV